MANTKEITADELIEVLKFTPRTYKIQLWGYGGEKVIGTVDRAQYEYCLEHQVDLQDIAWGDEDTVRDDLGLDPDMMPFPPGSWYEADNLAHVSGVSRNAGTLQIEDEKGKTVVELQLDDCDGCDGSPELNGSDEVYVNQQPEGTVVFVGSSNEKGTFFEGEIELRAPFQIEKLTLCYDDIDGEDIIHSVMYDGEEIDNYGGSTDGKSSDFDMYLITEAGAECYSPEEKDWGHPDYGTSPSDWESSPRFDFKKHKPVHAGSYSCVWSHFGTTYGSAYWDGKAFGEWEYGKFKPISNVQTWQGYNWDTSDWANQPKEPPNLVCDNKKCDWVGMSEERIEDAELNDHCPECNGTEFSWIDYDADTKLGRSNREKYIK